MQRPRGLPAALSFRFACTYIVGKVAHNRVCKYMLCTPHFRVTLYI